MKTAILIAIIAVIGFFAIRSLLRTFKGEGCSCGDGGKCGSGSCGCGGHDHKDKDHKCNCGNHHE
ncbi:FeoB-associated Cys-rich membrane protein [Fusobacterium sp.]|uniref:FeoB-associated Cys-rich membrane protein n=1 Tax=Fusobacterium sp. TaxID=68766 RepID=UPI0025BAC74D|nr:FeoB-associated Cys-rich membrane protein [Fusobacterium sp.]